jgi:tRNA U34 2-thiouridine synthase MnmA/TrmU
MASSCIVLYSGGLDSILACKALQEQGLTVKGIKFITPFFGYAIKGKVDEYKSSTWRKYGIEIEIVDISQPFIHMLKAPRHGYGKHFNPCIDCKILMLKEAALRLRDFKADFVATGEVIGQRPLSQRKDAMFIIERESETRGILLRPLSALMLPVTPMEKKGLVDRARLLDIDGRGRKMQLSLTEKYNIKDIPAPSGGCRLTDHSLSRRFRKLFDLWPDADANDFNLSAMGRIFLMPDNSLLVLGRDEKENEEIISFFKKSENNRDVLLKTTDTPGPVGLWRKSKDKNLIKLAASIICSFVKVNGHFLQKPIDLTISYAHNFPGKKAEKIQEDLNNIFPLHRNQVKGFDLISPSP